MGLGDGGSTREYPGGTQGYSSSDDGGESSESLDEPSTSESEPFWQRLGFESFRAYLDDLNRLRALYEPLPKGSPIPVAGMPGDDVGDVKPPPAIAPRVRQVNVKLRVDEGEDLDRAARIYGLAPATLARALVNRGVRAVFEANGIRPG